VAQNVQTSDGDRGLFDVLEVCEINFLRLSILKSCTDHGRQVWRLNSADRAQLCVMQESYDDLTLEGCALASLVDIVEQWTDSRKFLLLHTWLCAESVMTRGIDDRAGGRISS
jgi:hypothetical protein